MTLIVAAACAIVMVWLSENAYRRMTDVIVELQHTHIVRTSINTLVRDLVVAESSQRGFLLTGDSQYLAPYQKAVTGMIGLLKQLDVRTPQAMRESDAMVSFKTLLAQKLGEMSLTLRMREQDRPEVANFVISSNVGLEQMEAFRQQGDARSGDGLSGAGRQPRRCPGHGAQRHRRDRGQRRLPAAPALVVVPHR